MSNYSAGGGGTVDSITTTGNTTMGDANSDTVSIKGQTINLDATATITFQATQNDVNMVFSTTTGDAATANQFVLDADTGNVGFGTAGVGSKMKVKNTDAQVCLIVDQNGTGGALKVDGGKYSGSNTVAANKVVEIVGGGSTQHSLYINSNQDTGQTTSLVEFRCADNGFAQPVLKLDNLSTGDTLQICDAGTVVSVFDDEGNLGVGIAAPTQKLHVNGFGYFVGGSNQYKIYSTQVSLAGGPAAKDFITDGNAYTDVVGNGSGGNAFNITNPVIGSTIVIKEIGTNVAKVTLAGGAAINCAQSKVSTILVTTANSGMVIAEK